MNSLYNRLNALEKVCDECGGSGRDWYAYDKCDPCWKCNGSGYVTTDEGKAILSLLIHHQGKMLSFA